MKTRWAAAGWGCFLGVCLVFVAGRVRQGAVVDTSLLSLLPVSEGDPLVSEANKLLSQRGSRLMAFVVGHRDAATAAEMGRQLRESLKASVFVRHSLTDISPEQQKAVYEAYFPFRYQMLSPEDRERLQRADPVEPFAARLANSLYSPASAFFKNLIPRDPFLFFPERVRSWGDMAMPRPRTQLPEGISWVDNEGTAYAFAAVELAADPFDSKQQDPVIAWLADLRNQLQAQWPESRFSYSGVLHFAVAERLRTEREMAWISAGSLIGVLLLTLWVFSSVRTIGIAALPLLVGGLVAVSATLICFGHIHIITLAFGSSLIGVAVDYPLLYLSTHRLSAPPWDARRALGRITPSLLLGAGTTLMGYAALSLAPFPGLRQMALFSSAGLGAALVTVLVWLPGLLSRKATVVQNEPRLLAIGQLMLGALRRGLSRLSRSVAMIALVGGVLFIGGGLARLRFDDDIRRLQNPPAELARQAALVSQVTRGFGENRFILIQGETQDELLQRQERLQTVLRPWVLSGRLQSIQSLAPFLPSGQRQQDDRRLLQEAFLTRAAQVRSRLDGLGLSPEVSERFLQDLRAPLKVFPVEHWLESPASEMLRQLWIGSGRYGFASAVLVNGLADPQPLKEAVKTLPGVRYFDQIETYTSLFQRYRRLSLGLIALAYLGVWGLMIYRYGVRQGTGVAASPAVSVLLTFAGFGWWGVHAQLMHCLSALLVLSMGIDYSIHFAEAARSRHPEDTTVLAVLLCAMTTVLSFGLLAFCRTPVLSAVGVTVFSGMMLALLLAPLSYRRSRE